MMISCCKFLAAQVRATMLLPTLVSWSLFERVLLVWVPVP